MKVFQREVPGYSDECLEAFLERMLFPSSFFDQPVPVRGVCFAAGSESLKLAQEFATNRLGLGTITFRMETMATDTWRDISNLFTRPKAEVSRVGFLLRDLDLTSPELQERIAESLDLVENVVWLATVSDHRRLLPKLKLPFVVYLGLGPNEKMRFLAQGVQQIMPDEGSLRRAKQG